jgi:hypothetical protein
VTNAGTVVVVDSAGVTWSLNGKPVAPGLNSGVILVGQTLQQVMLLPQRTGVSPRLRACSLAAPVPRTGSAPPVTAHVPLSECLRHCQA